jgi:hypothetical protein
MSSRAVAAAAPAPAHTGRARHIPFLALLGTRLVHEAGECATSTR